MSPLLPSPVKQLTKCKTSFKVLIFNTTIKVWSRKRDDFHVAIGRNGGLTERCGPADELNYCRAPEDRCLANQLAVYLESLLLYYLFFQKCFSIQYIVLFFFFACLKTAWLLGKPVICFPGNTELQLDLLEVIGVRCKHLHPKCLAWCK